MNLRVLYMSNNKLASLNDIDKLAPLDKLEDLLLVRHDDGAGCLQGLGSGAFCARAAGHAEESAGSGGVLRFWELGACACGPQHGAICCLWGRCLQNLGTRAVCTQTLLLVGCEATGASRGLSGCWRDIGCSVGITLWGFSGSAACQC